MRFRPVPLSAMGTLAFGPLRRTLTAFPAGLGPVLAIAAIRGLVVGQRAGIAVVPGIGALRRRSAGGGDPDTCSDGRRLGWNVGQTRIACAAGGLRLGAAGRDVGMAVAGACALLVELFVREHRPC